MDDFTLLDDYFTDSWGDEEDDNVVGPAPRVEEVYVCDDEHETVVTLSTDAEVPPSWSCVTCSQPARLKNIEGEIKTKDEDTKKEVHAWDRLLTRRSEKEMEKQLKEHLKKLEAGEIGRIFTM